MNRIFWIILDYLCMCLDFSTKSIYNFSISIKGCLFHVIFPEGRIIMSDFKDIDKVNAGEKDEDKNVDGQEKICSCSCDCGPGMDPHSASTGFNLGNLARIQVK